ncbi:hypothetical protein ABME00_14725 [Citrobacter amalonaticus]|uniref:hypothetical protein n=1 Tax=Citrobacter amalonaticus TaxID=35703 RepID=UPI000B5EBE6A|nr:hypothetical protein [Citrobacter amalonaticus]SAZ42661.1 conserved protein of unknown function [Citrobacter amalonaticus]
MRLTVLDDDPGRKINPGVERYAVFLNGAEVKHVYTADDEKGEVISAVLDESGYVVTENGEVKRQTLFGKVIIKRQ